MSLGAIAQPPPAASSASPLAGSLPMCLPEDLQTAVPGEVIPVFRSNQEPLDLYPYLRRILTAKVYDLAVCSSSHCRSSRSMTAPTHLLNLCKRDFRCTRL